MSVVCSGDGKLDFAEFTEMMVGGDDERVVTQLTSHVEMLKEVYAIIEVKKSTNTGALENHQLCQSRVKA